MNFCVQSMIGFSMVMLLFLSIGTVAMKKPLKLWGIFAFGVGVQLFLFFPGQKIFAGAMIFFPALYFMKGIRIFAHRRKNVLTERKETSSPFADFFGRFKTMTGREWIGRSICLSGAAFFVSIFFPFRKIGTDIPEYLMYTAFVIFMIYWVEELFYILIIHIVAPLFVIKKETRKARLKEALMIEQHIGKGIMAAEPYLFFEKDEYYVSYRMFSEQIREIEGYICEYTVYTDISGNEFIKKCPRAVSSDREFRHLVCAEDLKTGYFIRNRLQYADSPKRKIVPVLLGFILPVILISATMLFLYLFLE